MNYDELVQLVFFFNKIKLTSYVKKVGGKYNLMVGHKTGSLPSINFKYQIL